MTSDMFLFEGHFDQRDGENEYTSKREVVAPNLRLAERFFIRALIEWFGDETVVESRYSDMRIRSVTNQFDYPIVRLSYVGRVFVDATGGTDGKMYHITHTIEEEN